METNWAAEHLQVIRTLMERSAIYRRALAPIMLTTGILGMAAAFAGYRLGFNTPRSFAGHWMSVSVLTLAVAYLLARRQALQADEAFWSPPTRRVTQALLAPLFVGMIVGCLVCFCPHWDFLAAWGLPVFWMLLYGCALQAAGFFMQRGIRLFGWMFILGGSLLAVGRCWLSGPVELWWGHMVMGALFGGLHLAYGLYLYFTEKSRAK